MTDQETKAELERLRGRARSIEAKQDEISLRINALKREVEDLRTSAAVVGRKADDVRHDQNSLRLDTSTFIDEIENFEAKRQAPPVADIKPDP